MSIHVCTKGIVQGKLSEKENGIRMDNISFILHMETLDMHAFAYLNLKTCMDDALLIMETHIVK